MGSKRLSYNFSKPHVFVQSLYCSELLPSKLANKCVKEASLFFYTREANQTKKIQNREGIMLHFFFVLYFLFSRRTRTLFEQARYISVRMIGCENNCVLTPRVSTTWCIYSGREHATFLREIMSGNVSQTKDIISCEAWITVLNTHDPLDRI